MSPSSLNPLMSTPCIVPQYSDKTATMLEVQRSRFYYAKSRAMVILPTYTLITEKDPEPDPQKSDKDHWKIWHVAKPLMGKAIDHLQADLKKGDDSQDNPISKQEQIVKKAIREAIQPLYFKTRGIANREYFGR